VTLLGIGTEWEQVANDEPAPAPARAPAASTRHTRPGSRIGTQKIATRDLIPGLRSSEVAPITVRIRRLAVS
jgi:hypothetical protein